MKYLMTEKGKNLFKTLALKINKKLGIVSTDPEVNKRLSQVDTELSQQELINNQIRDRMKQGETLTQAKYNVITRSNR